MSSSQNFIFAIRPKQFKKVKNFVSVSFVLIRFVVQVLENCQSEITSFEYKNFRNLSYPNINLVTDISFICENVRVEIVDEIGICRD